MKPRLIFPLFVLFAMLAGCRLLGTGADAAPDRSSDPVIITFDTLASHLQAAGATVEPLGEVSQPFFPVSSHVIRVNESEVQVFEFSDANAHREAAESVAPDGSSVGTTMVNWLAPAHFYKTDNVIALYVGDDPAVMKLLESVLGPQFAGG